MEKFKFDRESFILAHSYKQNERRSENSVYYPIIGDEDVEFVKKYVMANGFRIFNKHNEYKLKICLANADLVIVDFWPGCTPYIERDAKELGLSKEEYIDKHLKMLLAYMAKYGDRVWWDYTGEQDTGAEWPKKMFPSKKAAYKWYWECYFTNKPGRYDPARKFTDAGLMKKYKLGLKTHNISIQCGQCFGIHYYYHWGAKLVWLERNCFMGNVQIGISFLRGASKQYDRPFGSDFSPWGGLDMDTTHFSLDGKCLGGVSPSLLLREWVTAYMSGTNFLLMEGSNRYIFAGTGKERKLSPLGKEAKRFADMTLHEKKDRGKPHVPFGIMLPFYHGWDPRDHILWGGCIPYTRRDQMIDVFFKAIFPGQEGKYQQVYWEKPGWKKQQPWSSIAEYDKMRANGFDVSAYEAGNLVPSTWGDSFDVVLENCSLEVLQRSYKVLVLLGDVVLEGKLKDKLEQYVKSGGVLIVNTLQVKKGKNEFLGIEKTGEQRRQYHISCKKCGKFYDEGYCEVDAIRPISAETIAEDNTKNPVVTSNRVGKGEVVVVAFPGFQGADSKPMLEGLKDVLNHYFSRYSIADVKGLPIQYLVNRNKNGIIVTLVNNFGEAWEGEIMVPEKEINGKVKITEWWTGRDVSYSSERGEIIFKAKISAFGFGIFEVYAH